MKKINKIITILLIGLLAFSLFGCKNKEKTEEDIEDKTEEIIVVDNDDANSVNKIELIGLLIS